MRFLSSIRGKKTLNGASNTSIRKRQSHRLSLHSEGDGGRSSTLDLHPAKPKQKYRDEDEDDDDFHHEMDNSARKRQQQQQQQQQKQQYYYCYETSTATGEEEDDSEFPFSSGKRKLNLKFAKKVKDLRSELDGLMIRSRIEDVPSANSSSTTQMAMVDEDDKLYHLHNNTNNDLDPSLPSFLVGREKETQLLQSKLSNFIENPMTAVVSVSGVSGTGKTALVKQLKAPTVEAGGYFCLGKFDQAAQRAQPYKAFVGVSNDLAEQILEQQKIQQKQENEQDHQAQQEQHKAVVTVESSSEGCGGVGKDCPHSASLKERIQEAVGEQGIQLLLEIFPGLKRVLKVESKPTTEATAIERKVNQLQFVVRQLFRVLSTKDSPLVLVLDDGQWADIPSINLVEALLADRDTSFILIATSRSDELSDDHPFAKMLRDVSDLEKGIQEVETIDVTNLEEDDVQSIVANALRETEEYVSGLAEVVFEKTRGNAFFVREYLQMLVNDDLLTYNVEFSRWLWEDGTIRDLPVADNVASSLAKRIHKLSEPSQELLKIAACLGQEFEGELLSTALMSLAEARLMELSSISAVFSSCKQCLDVGLLERSGDGKYSFVHDHIQAASFKLIPEDELPRLQLAIGRGILNGRLANKTSGGGGIIRTDDILFLAVDLCNSGRSALDAAGKIDLAWRNCKAAEKAIRKSAFDAAIAYGKAGLLCLEQLPVDNDETETIKLDLHAALAKASFCIGDGPGAELYAGKVIDSDFSFDDKYPGYVTKMLSQFGQHRLDDAIETALFILRELGYFKNVGRVPSKVRVLTEIVKTKTLLKKYTAHDLMDLPLMTDENRHRAIHIFCRISTVAFSSYPNLFLVLALTATRWAVKYGVSMYSPPVFAVYGLVACGIMEDFDHGTMIGEVALSLSEKLQASSTIGMTTHVTFGFITHWKHDMRTSRKPMEYALRTALQMGDINNAICLVFSLDQFSFFTGYHNLGELEVIIRKSVANFRSYGQESYAAQHSCDRQMVLNLIGRCDDPLILTGDAMDEEEALQTALEQKDHLAVSAIRGYKGFTAYYYEEHEFAYSNLLKVKKEDCIGYITAPRRLVFLGLAYVAAALEGTNTRQNLRRSRTILKTLKQWVAAGNVNIPHLVRLLEAEITSCVSSFRSVASSPDTAAQLYDEAIKLGELTGFRNDLATIHARVAHYYLIVKGHDEQLESRGRHHLEKSIHGYNEWGALGVAQKLTEKYSNFLDNEHSA